MRDANEITKLPSATHFTLDRESAEPRIHAETVFSFHTRIGLAKNLPAGYGDGLARACSNRGAVLICGQRRPILGRVCMDQTVVDITSVPDEVRCGDPVVLVGRHGAEIITVAEFSAWADTIPWETLCSVTKRVPRHYRNVAGV